VLPVAASSASSAGVTGKALGDSPAASSTDVGVTDGSTATPDEGSIVTDGCGPVSGGRERGADHHGGLRRDREATFYEVTLEKRDGTRLGMSILERDGADGRGLLVTAVTGGLVQAWNSNHSAQPGKPVVRPGDRIVEVNGVRDCTSQLLEECRTSQVLHMTIRRALAQELTPGVHLISLDKTGGMKMGVDISQHDGRTLLVTEVREGLVQAWNRDNPIHQIFPGDRIIRVNEVQNDARKLLDECRKSGLLNLAIKKAKTHMEPHNAGARTTASSRRPLQRGTSGADHPNAGPLRGSRPLIAEEGPPRDRSAAANPSPSRGLPAESPRSAEGQG